MTLTLSTTEYKFYGPKGAYYVSFYETGARVQVPCEGEVLLHGEPIGDEKRARELIEQIIKSKK